MVVEAAVFSFDEQSITTRIELVTFFYFCPVKMSVLLEKTLFDVGMKGAWPPIYAYLYYIILSITKVQELPPFPEFLS